MCRRHHKTYACHMAKAGLSRSHQLRVHLRVGKRSHADHTQLAACFLGVDTFKRRFESHLIRPVHSQLDLVRLRKVISLMPIEGHFFYSNKLSAGFSRACSILDNYSVSILGSVLGTKSSLHEWLVAMTLIPKFMLFSFVWMYFRHNERAEGKANKHEMAKSIT